MIGAFLISARAMATRWRCAAGQLQAVLADRGVVAGREAHDEIVRMRGLGGGDDLGLAGARFSERDVVADAAAEQIDVTWPT